MFVFVMDQERVAVARFSAFLCVVQLVYQVTGQTLTLEPTTDQTVCINSNVQFTCNVTSSSSLIWRNTNGDITTFITSDMITTTRPLGAFTASLNSVNNPLSSTVTFTEVTSDACVVCTGASSITSARSFNIKGENPRPMGVSPVFNAGSVTVSWNAPTDVPNCCVENVVELCGTVVGTTTSGTSITVPLQSDTTGRVCVHCRDGAGRDGHRTCNTIDTKPRFSVTLDDTGVVTTEEENNCTVWRPNIMSRETTCLCDDEGVTYESSTRICEFTKNCTTRCARVTWTNVFGSSSTETFCLFGMDLNPTSSAIPTSSVIPTFSPSPTTVITALSSGTISAIAIGVALFLVMICVLIIFLVMILHHLKKTEKHNALLNMISKSQEWLEEEMKLQPLPQYELVRKTQVTHYDSDTKF